MRLLELCAGIGGFSLGLERTGGFKAVAFCEIDPFCQKVLAKHWPEVPCFPDLKKMRGDEVENIDVVVAGFPCQPFSLAGARGGKSDPRHLWPEVARIIRNIRPRYVLLENVTGHLSLGFGDVLGDLAACGYDAEWSVLSACSLGFPHTRERVFIVAYPNSESTRKQRRRLQCSSNSLEKRHLHLWPDEPEPERVVDGIPNRVDRNRALGNAVVPAVAQYIGEQIMAAERASL